MSVSGKILTLSAIILITSAILIHYRQTSSSKSNIYYKNSINTHLFTAIIKPIMSIFGLGASSGEKDEEWKNVNTIYEFTVKDIDDQDVKLDKYKGKVLLIVNVASKCGFTKSNYKELNELYAMYHDQGLEILGFPCNQFGHQEPGCTVDIKEFITKNEVKWDMFAKVNVNGDGAIPLYSWLKSKVKGTLFDAIKWNFTKFLINREGVPVARYAPNTKPMEFKDAIEAELKKN